MWPSLAQKHGLMGAVAEAHAGLQIKKTDTTSAADEPDDGQDWKPYIERLSVMRPFALLPSPAFRRPRWVLYGPQLRRPGSIEVFESEKVLINSNRNPGSPWRMVAAIAPAGLYFSDNFHGIVPKTDGVTVEEIAAVLNGPVANAWLDAHSRKRKIVLGTLKELPFPSFDDDTREKLRRAVRQLEKAILANLQKVEEGLFYDRQAETPDVAELIAAVDGMVYDAYGISPVARMQIEKVMSVEKRPG
jgi:hypothetical protein